MTRPSPRPRPTPTAPAAHHTTGRRVNLSPSRDDLVDAGFVLALMFLALIGFRTTYSGVDYLVAGVSGAILGLLIAHLANALKQPMIAIAAMTLAVFFLLGGAIVLRGTAIAGLVPSGDTFRGLADQSVHGWKDLLTTLPPVDGTGPLLVLPYILGLLGGVGGLCLARRLRPALAPVFAPLAILIAVILLGTQTPAARLLQGGVFGVVALGWITLRSQRLRPPLQSGAGRLARAVTVGVLLVVSAAGAALITPHVPGQGGSRLVLRKYVKPPFDIGQYSSPLAGFRKYTKPSKLNLYNVPLFTVRGIPAKTPMRIATLDSYDGVTFTAANNASPTTSGVPDTYQRVGTEITNPARGKSVSYTVTIDRGYQVDAVRLADAYWLPTAGSLTELNFHGSHAVDHANYFRYNLATSTGILPDKLDSGDTFTAHATLDSPELTKTVVLSSQGSVTAEAGAPLKTKAADWSGGSGNTTAQVLAIASYLRSHGHYTDGEKGNSLYLPGHYRQRLLNFVADPQIAGDDEQYAAAYALMIGQLGVPSRVVYGAVPESRGVVKGRDIRAWVEVAAADGTWRTISSDRFIKRNNPPKPQPPQQQTEQQGKIVPPPARGKPRSGLDDASDAVARSRTSQRNARAAQTASGIPAWIVTTAKWVGTPLIIIAALCALIILAKMQRRRLRRTRGTPSNRLTGGWREVVDHAQDLGSQPVLAGTTRKEQATLLAVHDLGRLARSADSHVFGPNNPDSDAAARFWAEVDDTRRQMSRLVSRSRRIRAALSLATFLPARSRGGTV